MELDIISQDDSLLVRRLVLQPGEALPWHRDLCRRISVVVRGDLLGIEFRESGKIESYAVHPGMTGWDEPEDRVHRGVNLGDVPYEEVVIFFLTSPDQDPQPEEA